MNKKRILVVGLLILLLSYLDMFAYLEEIQTYVMIDGRRTRNPYPHEIIKYVYEKETDLMKSLFLFFLLLIFTISVLIGLVQEAKDIDDSIWGKFICIVLLSFFISAIIMIVIPIGYYEFYRFYHKKEYVFNAVSYFFSGIALSWIYEICQIQLQKRLEKEILHTNKIGEVFKYLFLILGILVFFVYASFFLNTPFYSKENTPSMPALMSVYCLFGGLLGAELFSIFYKSKYYNSIKNIQFKDLINKLLEKP